MVDTVKILGALLGGGNMSSGSGANILKSVLGAAMSGGSGGQGNRGGLGDLLGSVLSGAQGDGGQQGGGLGGMLGGLLGGGSGGGGGLGGMLGEMAKSAGSQGGQGGGLGDLLGGVLGGQPQGASGAQGADLSDLIGAALNQFGQAEKAAIQNQEPEPFERHSPDLDIGQVQDQATIMIRAMVNAAKADGRVDKEEQQKILGQLGSVTQDEIDFINSELESPLNIGDFARSVPRGMEPQVYAMSLMAIDLDSQAEARYLHDLGQSMGMQPEVMNQVHRQLGAQVLYT